MHQLTINVAFTTLAFTLVPLYSKASAVGVYEDIYPSIVNLSLLDSVQDCDPDTSPDGTCPLFFGLLSSFGGVFRSSGCIPAVQVALDEINNDSSILPGYSLHYTLKDSQCDRQVAESAFFSFIIHPPVKLGIIGAGCSIATEATAELVYYFNLTQISYVSSSPILTNRQLFKTYFQMLASEINLAYGYYGLIQQFRWKKVALIVEQQNLFILVMDFLTQQLRANNISYTEVFFRSSEGITHLGDRLFDPEARIFLLSMYSSHAVNVICKASAEKKYYPRYQFILIGWYGDNWWVGSANEQKSLMDQYNCSVEDRKRVLQHSLTIIYDQFISNFSKVVDSGITGTIFNERYNQLLSVSSFGNERIIYAQKSYDATWTLARALNNTLTDLVQNRSLNSYLHQFNSDILPNKSFGLQHFTYNNSAMLNVTFHHLAQTDFIGLTGNIKFNEDGVRKVALIIVRQYRNSTNTGVLEQVMVAAINISDPSNLVLNFVKGFDNQNLWPDGVIPYDGTVQYMQATVNIAITIVCSILATVGLILTCICIIFNFIFRKRKLLKLGGTNLNNLLATGAVIFYINIYIYAMDPKDKLIKSVLCNIYPWFFSIGYSLFFGTIIMKMGRVYYIFSNALHTAPKKAIHDWKLAIGVLILVIIDVTILTIYTIANRNNLLAIPLDDRTHPEDSGGENNPLGIVTKYYIYRCKSPGRDIAVYILYGIKALLQVIALIFAFSIRKVNVKGLNDSQYVIASVYLGSVFLTIVIVCVVTLGHYVNYLIVVTCTIYSFGATATLLLIFIPKMIDLYRDPNGTKIFNDPHFELNGTTPSLRNDQNTGEVHP